MKLDIASTIGNNIKKFREEMKFSRNDLADKAGISSSGLANYENGNRVPSVEVLMQLATILQRPIDFLVGSNLSPCFGENGEFNYMLDSQFGYFNPNDEGYIEFLERNLSLSDNYKKDNIFMSPSYPSFTSELMTSIDKSYGDSNNTPLSTDGLKQFLEEQTDIHNVWSINAEKELPLPEIAKLLHFYRHYNFNDFYEFINHGPFIFSDLDIDIKNIIQNLRHDTNKNIKIPGGFTCKPETIDINLAYKSLVDLIFYIRKEDSIHYIDDKSYEKLLMKVCDLLEFELFRLEKENTKNK